jgi:amino acid transporter
VNNVLKKELSLSQVIAMAAGGMIAAWMVEIRYWYEISGTGSLLSLIACAIIIIPLCLIYSEMTSMLPYAGGENIWTSNAFNWDVGWIVGWFMFLLYLSAMPNVTMGISTMISYVYPMDFRELKIVSAIIITIWYILVNLEIKWLAVIQNIMFWGTSVVAVVVSCVFIFSDAWNFSNLSPWFPKGAGGFAAGLGLLMFKFIGFDLIPQMVEESNFPRKKILWAYIGSMIVTILVYGLAIIGVGGIVSIDWILEQDIIDPRVADILGWHWLGLVIVIMGAITCVTTLTGFWMAASRTLYGAANQRQVTRVLAKINKFGQPWVANLVVYICSMYFCLMAPEAWINYIFTITVGAAGVIYLFVAMSFLKLRKTHPEWERPYKVNWGTFMGIESIIFCIYVLYQCVLVMDFPTTIALIIYFAIGLLLYFYALMMQKRAPEDWHRTVLSQETLLARNNKNK